VRTLSKDDLRKLIGTQKIKVSDINQKELVEYEALPARKVFETIYGEKWKTEEEVLFTCKDGYQPSLPRSRFDQFEGFFALGKTTGVFTLTNKSEGNKTVDLSPMYLIWNLPSDSASSDNGLFWPYQLVGVDLIAFADRLQGLRPPGTVSESVQRGYSAFRTHCAVCHRINGLGGQGAPELNYPKNVTEYYRPEFLKQWISNPSSIRYMTPMPGLTATLKDRDRVIKDIIEYLKVMAQHKSHP
jgi:mono/diheme cytochrome c family protein